jgi:hypothetical protein
MLTNIIRAMCAGMPSEAQVLAAVRAASVFGWDVEMNDQSDPWRTRATVGEECDELLPSRNLSRLRQSSWPINVPDEQQRWGAMWTNTAPETHPQVVFFTVYAICVDEVRD